MKKLALLAAAVVAVAGLVGYLLLMREDLSELQRECGRASETIQVQLGIRAALRCTVQEGSADQLNTIHVQVTLHEVPKTLSSEDAREGTEVVIRRMVKRVTSVGFDLKQLDGPPPAP